MKRKASVYSILLVLSLLLTACAIQELLRSDEGREFIKGRVETLSFAVIQELPDEAPTIRALAGVVRGVAAGDDLSLGSLTAAISTLDIKELDSPYAPLLINEIVDWYGFYQVSNADNPPSENEALYRAALEAIAEGLEDGIEEWMIFLEATGGGL